MKPRLLIVDDERPLLAAMERYFTRRNFDVDCTCELEEAAALLNKFSYQVAIIDLQLTKVKGVEGLELLELIRERRPETQTIVLTAYGSPQVEAEARRLGVRHFFQKPKALPELVEVVSQIVGGSNA